MISMVWLIVGLDDDYKYKMAGRASGSVRISMTSSNCHYGGKDTMMISVENDSEEDDYPIQTTAICSTESHRSTFQGISELLRCGC